jgi:Transposase, Mutator family/FG-GAP-like repeat
MGIDKELIDKLLAGYKGPEDLIGEQGLLKQLTKALVERAMDAELTHHLGYEKHDTSGRGSGNSRNGTSRKKLKGDFGEAEIEVPLDRNGTFTPHLIHPAFKVVTPSRMQVVLCGPCPASHGISVSSPVELAGHSGNPPRPEPACSSAFLSSQRHRLQRRRLRLQRGRPFRCSRVCGSSRLRRRLRSDPHLGQRGRNIRYTQGHRFVSRRRDRVPGGRDFNGDGKIDFAVALFSRSIRVYLNNGDGAFRSAPGLNSTGGNPIPFSLGR